MTIRYVGQIAAGAANGTTWNDRYGGATGLNDCEGVVAAGDIVYVGPGVYREMLTCDVSGTTGNPITYIGDVTGEHTDGVGGIVRITGSDDDMKESRTACVYVSGKHYRTWSGFSFDLCSVACIDCDGSPTNLTVTYCNFGDSSGGSIYGHTAGINWTVNNCIFTNSNSGSYAINFWVGAAANNRNYLIQNCLVMGGGSGFSFYGHGGVAVKNCTFIGGLRQILNSVALNAGQTIQISNCIFCGCSLVSMQAVSTAEIVENYNIFYGNIANRTNVSVGSYSLAYSPNFNKPTISSGFRFPWNFGELNKWSQIARTSGSGAATDDYYGMTRPTTDAKKSWGAIQYVGAARETTTVDSGVSLKLADAGMQFIMRVAVTAVSTTFSLKVYREANYAGTNPQMIIRQPGVADTTVTDVGSAATWNTLNSTITPAALPPYVDIFFVSNNTATTGSYAAYCDTFSAV